MASPRLKGEENSLSPSGGVGFPAGLFQNPLEGAFAGGSSTSPLAAAALAENATLASQKEVSFIDFPAGRSRINRPSWEVSQKPPLTASDVQTYVFCYAYQLRLATSTHSWYVAHRVEIIDIRSDFPEVRCIMPFVYYHSQLALRGTIKSN